MQQMTVLIVSYTLTLNAPWQWHCCNLIIFKYYATPIVLKLVIIIKIGLMDYSYSRALQKQK